MNEKLLRIACALFVCALAGGAPAAAERAKPRKKADAPAPVSAAAAPRVEVAVESVLDRRTTSDFPPPGLTVALALQGEDAASVRSARPRVTRALDDTGKNLAEGGSKMMMRGSDGWQQASGDGPPTPRVELASPSRKAKTLTSFEGVVETYLPSRDAAATVKVERILAKRDKPLAVPALASRRIRIQVLSKAGLEREKKQAEAKKQAQAAAKKKKGKTDGLEEMGEAMVGALASTLESLFTTAGDNDLILKVDDPGKKIFGVDLAAADGTPIHSYGTTDYDKYRIVRMLEPIPDRASLLVRLKTPKSFGEVPFSLTNVKLP